MKTIFKLEPGQVNVEGKDWSAELFHRRCEEIREVMPTSTTKTRVRIQGAEEMGFRAIITDWNNGHRSCFTVECVKCGQQYKLNSRSWQRQHSEKCHKGL